MLISKIEADRTLTLLKELRADFVEVLKTTPNSEYAAGRIVHIQLAINLFERDKDG